MRLIAMVSCLALALPAVAADPTEPYEIVEKVMAARGAEHFPPGVDTLAVDVRYRFDDGPQVDARGVLLGWQLVLSAASQGGRPLEAFSAVTRDCRHRVAAGDVYENCEAPRLLPAAFDHWKMFLLEPLHGDAGCNSFDLLPRVPIKGVQYFGLSCNVNTAGNRLRYRFWVNPRSWRVDYIDRDDLNRSSTEHLKLSDYQEFMGVQFPRTAQFLRSASAQPLGTLRVTSLVANPVIDVNADREPRLIDVAGTPAAARAPVAAPPRDATLDLETLIARNSAALGGAEALRALRARAATLEVKSGDEALQVRMLITRDNEILLESVAGAEPRWARFDDGKRCWMKTPDAAHGVACDEDTVDRLRQIVMFDRAFSLEALRPYCEREFALTGDATPGRGLRTVRCLVSDSYLLKVSVNPSGWRVESIDIMTFTPEGTLYSREQMSYEDYRLVDGLAGALLWPHARHSDSEFFTIRQLTLDPPLDRKRFTMP